MTKDVQQLVIYCSSKKVENHIVGFRLNSEKYADLRQLQGCFCYSFLSSSYNCEFSRFNKKISFISSIMHGVVYKFIVKDSALLDKLISKTKKYFNAKNMDDGIGEGTL